MGGGIKCCPNILFVKRHETMRFPANSLRLLDQSIMKTAWHEDMQAQETSISDSARKLNNLHY
jgi:hypothetical protein